MTRVLIKGNVIATGKLEGFICQNAVHDDESTYDVVLKGDFTVEEFLTSNNAEVDVTGYAVLNKQ